MFTLRQRKPHNKIIFLIIISLLFQGSTFAAERLTLKDRMIGPTLKTLARMFVAVTNIRKLKKYNIRKIDKMDEKKFNKKYAQVYALLQDLPEGLKADYNLIEHMPKEQAIKTIESLDKRKIYKIIAAVPNDFIARQFKCYLHDKNQARQKNGYAKKIDDLWYDATGKAVPATAGKEQDS